MPNHTINTVQMKGIRRKKLYSFINGKKCFDFNKLVPEPMSIQCCPEQYIDNGNRHLMHNDERSWFDWYDWHCDYWGTKWNSYNYSDNPANDDEISFWTAWSEPEPIWEALSRRYPKETIYIRASYEDGLETESTWLNGSRVTYREWETNCEEDCD